MVTASTESDACGLRSGMSSVREGTAESSSLSRFQL
jgi:hypothetical protein